MTKMHKVSVNGETFIARSGQRLLDAALAAGADLPHDCRAGTCGTCLTRVRSGLTLGGETSQAGTVHACQAMVFSDLVAESEPRPPEVRLRGRLAAMHNLAPDIVEVTLSLSERLEILPGQYCRFRFQGYPVRTFSPTAPLTGICRDNLIRLHVQRQRGGTVTPQIGREIRPGHPVRIDGPFGSAYLRPGSRQRLVLLASGTGFAPIWSIACAALQERPGRQIILIAGARSRKTLYITPAIRLLNSYPGVTAMAYLGDLGAALDQCSPHGGNLPAFCREDVVFAAGSPAMVAKAGAVAAAAGATFHADPFEAFPRQSQSWTGRAMAWLNAG
ncbi:MAG: 2Fe-2S iron-sulfur cluster binding domain-containing protein [Alphaproteobacteria bacterium]|nr:2Fe-2S iron-sulfur cluster binding domain-containing protein [Alphaproteobacteria bacterium]